MTLAEFDVLVVVKVAVPAVGSARQSEITGNPTVTSQGAEASGKVKVGKVELVEVVVVVPMKRAASTKVAVLRRIFIVI